LISYAQNYEDVMLARVFRGQATGFYVDIGASHATLHSVTKHFYDLGWHGINVEALPENLEAIRAARPRDINVNVAVGYVSGTTTFYEVRGTGLSTTRRDYAEQHAKEGWAVTDITVRTVDLAALLDEYARDAVIDFLKIDVEGAEADVIRGGDWRRHRPRVLVVEATLPLRSDESYSEWDGILVGNGFVFGYFDGLNRWYVREEERSLLQYFTAPPNVFDEFTPVRVQELQSEVEVLRRRLKSAMKKADRLDALSKTLLGKLAMRLT
jgi:FkbM family methyltransferase